MRQSVPAGDTARDSAEAASSTITAFHARQYDELRKALLANATEERQMERYVLLACGGFYSWLLTQEQAGSQDLEAVAFIPTGIVFLAAVRARALANGMQTHARYLRRLEAEIYKDAPDTYSGPRGWETFLDQRSNYVARYLLSENLFWVVLTILTLAAPLALLLHG